MLTHPFEKRRLRHISAYNANTVRDRTNHKEFNYDETYEVDHGLSNEL